MGTQRAPFTRNNMMFSSSEKYATKGARKAFTRLSYQATRSWEAQDDDYDTKGVILSPRLVPERHFWFSKKEFCVKIGKWTPPKEIAVGNLRNYNLNTFLARREAKLQNYWYIIRIGVSTSFLPNFAVLVLRVNFRVGKPFQVFNIDTKLKC